MSDVLTVFSGSDFDTSLVAFDNGFADLDLKLDQLKIWVDSNINSVNVRKYEGNIGDISLFNNRYNVIDSEDYYVKVVGVNLTHSDTIIASHSNVFGASHPHPDVFGASRSDTSGILNYDNRKETYYHKLSIVKESKDSLERHLDKMIDIRDYLENNQVYDSDIIKSYDSKIEFRKVGFVEISKKYYSHIGHKHIDI